jgi:protein-tyrosine-phosphatase
VVTALAERGITLTGVSPKAISTELLASADLVVTMSHHPTGPPFPGASTHQQHWQLDFPGDDLEAMRAFCTEVDPSFSWLTCRRGTILPLIQVVK